MLAVRYRQQKMRGSFKALDFPKNAGRKKYRDEAVFGWFMTLLLGMMPRHELSIWDIDSNFKDKFSFIILLNNVLENNYKYFIDRF